MAEALKTIIDAARSGDRKALDALAACADRFVRIFHGGISRHLRQTTGSTLDFVLEGLAEALAGLRGFEYRSDEQFYAWVSRHIRNRILIAARDAGRLKRAGRPAALGDGVREIPSPEAGGTSLVSAGEVREAVAQSLLGLQLEHSEEMEAVTLKIFEGESWPAIRDRLGLSSDKRARTLFARGLDLLRPRVESLLGEEALDDFLRL